MNYPVPKIELFTYFLIWTAHSILAFVISSRSSNKVGKWLDHWLEDSNYFNGFRMDNSDTEWKLFRMTIPGTLFALSIHSVVFKLAQCLNVAKRIHSNWLLLFWLVFHITWSSLECILLISTFTLVLIGITSVMRRQLFCWIFAIVFISKISDFAPFSRDPTKYYREFNLYLYSIIKVINLCIYLARNKDQRLDQKLALDFCAYMLYPPYSMALIVLFEDFRKQYSIAMHSQSDWEPISSLLRRILRIASKLCFSFFLLEMLLHLCRVNALFNSPFTMLKNYNNYELASMAYVAGQMFHIKYCIIFGLLGLFSTVDGMTAAPATPICVSRVSKYSQMWRHFDRGLYIFLRDQVYIPLVSQPIPFTNAAIRKLMAMSSVFFFVLTWHGVNSNYSNWVCLSALGLCIERIGTELILPSQLFQRTILPRLTPANFIRLKAVAMLTTVIPGIFGIFFFLGRAGVGDYIFRHVLVEGITQILTLNIHFLNSGWVFSHLLLMGYAFNHVCIYLEQRQRSRLAPKKIT